MSTTRDQAFKVLGMINYYGLFYLLCGGPIPGVDNAALRATLEKADRSFTGAIEGPIRTVENALSPVQDFFRALNGESDHFVEIQGTPSRETLLYEVTGKGERLSHRMFDSYAFNGMGATNIAWEKTNDAPWTMIYLHPARNDPGFPKTDMSRHVVDQKKLEQIATLAEQHFRITKLPIITISYRK